MKTIEEIAEKIYLQAKVATLCHKKDTVNTLLDILFECFNTDEECFEYLEKNTDWKEFQSKVLSL